MSTTQRSGWSATASGAPSLAWLLVASSWLLLLLLPGGATAWLGFGIIAAIGRRRSWWIASVAYSVAAFVFGVVDDPPGGILQGTLTIVTIVHGLVANATWLGLLWARRENNQTITGTARMSGSRSARGGGSSGRRNSRRQAPSVSPEGERLMVASGADLYDYIASPEDIKRAKAIPNPARETDPKAAAWITPEAHERVSSERHASSRPRSRPAAAPAERVDVNTASQRALVKATGLDRRQAKALIAERSKRGGFASLEDFATAAGMQPHEIVRLQETAFCSGRPRPRRSFGGRLDY